MPNLGTLGLRVHELFAMYATDGRTKATLTAPFPAGEGITTLSTIANEIKTVYATIIIDKFDISVETNDGQRLGCGPEE